MKTSYICWLALAACAASAQAQTGVSIYGIIDANLQYGDNGKEKQTSLQSGGLSQSRIGFMGSEDLGGGLSAIFNVENGFNVDNGAAAQGGLLFGRVALVGLSSKRLGALTLGRQYEPLHTLHTKFSTHQAGFGDAAGAFIPTINDVRFDNSIKYVTPSMAGLTLTAFVALGENTSVPNATTPAQSYGNLFNLQANFERGPLAAAFSYADKKKSPLLPDNHTTYSTAALSYDFGAIKPYLMVETIRNDRVTTTTQDFNFWSLAADMPLGPGRLNASLGSLRNRSAANAGAKSYGLVYDYLLSKRSNLYLGYAKVANQASAAYFVGSGNGFAIAAAGNGADPQAVVLGMRHKF
ncbi:porin [Duganella sp. FT92W]|uniref:Porin n=1 Tax=Pseudoduganella rivuli TaxID=2666085 RepID=A0A7X2IIK8_9BURK|nr:porin [Pseudoduganella rivuli]MRV70480.1 porin [Pseudoduganella rivuli]